MSIKKLKIKNFKCFSDWFTVEFEKGINILVGNNGTGKSTILEAVNLVLTGTYHGKNIRNEISPYLFNKKAVDEFIKKRKEGKKVEPPEIVIEAYFEHEIAECLGDGNSELNTNLSGISLSISFDDDYAAEYEELCKTEISTLPIEYYEVKWSSFAREYITARSIPIKTAMIDTTSYTPTSGSDIYISRIVKNILDNDEVVGIAQAHRVMKERFSEDDKVKGINNKLSDLQEGLSVSVDLGNKNSWETSLITNVNDVPYNNVGKGYQCLLKTQLALSDRKIENKHVILIEEPECHLSYSNLNVLLEKINEAHGDKQVIITTHSSFVSNKLGLEKLILLGHGKTLRLKDLTVDTVKFFKKASGYDTLRLLLADRTILVEGDSDELIVQKAYMDLYGGRLPIHDGVDVISVGTSFLRFLEIAKSLQLRVAVVTDNDGNINAINSKYEQYLGENAIDNIRICYDPEVHKYEGEIEDYNYNTLEPCIYRANSLGVLNDIFNTEYTCSDDMLRYMKSHKTDVALKIFESDKRIEFPKYINEAIEI